MIKILLVEDDSGLGISLSKTLEDEAFKVSWMKSLSEAKEKNVTDYDIIILDWMLPDGQGIDYLKLLRAEGHQTPIILLTARADLIDKVLGLESGANDYITKPFEPRELVARIRSQYRTASSRPLKPTQRLIFQDLEIDIEKHVVKFKGEQIQTTKMEFNLLKLLAENPNQTFSRESLLDKVWGFDNYPTTRTIDTHVLQLRQKISSNIIETVRGIGYRFGSVN